MKSIFIMYMPGSAGNLLCRLFSLSPETIPQAPLALIEHCIARPTEIPTLPQRIDMYLFSKALDYPNWQQFHRAWPDYLNSNLFPLWNGVLESKFSKVVYSIHPHEFMLKQPDIDTISDATFYYINLDLSKYQAWIDSSQAKLGFEYRPDFDGEYKKFVKFRDAYQMMPINLTSMLESNNCFINEYLRIAQSMDITPDVENAVTLFNDWKILRGPQ